MRVEVRLRVGSHWKLTVPLSPIERVRVRAGVPSTVAYEGPTDGTTKDHDTWAQMHRAVVLPRSLCHVVEILLQPVGITNNSFGEQKRIENQNPSILLSSEGSSFHVVCFDVIRENLRSHSRVTVFRLSEESLWVNDHPEHGRFADARQG